MAGIYEEMGVSKETVEEAGTQSVGNSIPDVKVYDALVNQMYIRTTDSGAKMFAVSLNLADYGDWFWETCTHAGDAKGNKETFGVHTMTYALQACGLTNPDAVKGPVMHKGTQIQAIGIPSSAGKKIKVGIRHEENLYQGSISEKAVIQAFLDPDGKDGAGEDKLADLEAFLEKNPLKKIKQAAGAPGSAPAASANAADTQAAASSGWN